jgi:hypothetical protein
VKVKVPVKENYEELELMFEVNNAPRLRNALGLVAWIQQNCSKEFIEMLKLSMKIIEEQN